MAITGYVVDKSGKVLSDEDLSKKVITHKGYYDLVLPIRKRINDEVFSTRYKNGKCCWNFNIVVL